MRKVFLLLTVAALFITCLPAPAPAATVAERQLFLKNAVIIVVNDLSGTHTVSLGSSYRTLNGKGSRAVFILPPSNQYVMLNLDSKPDGFYHLGSPTAGIKVIYTSQFKYGPF